MWILILGWIAQAAAQVWFWWVEFQDAKWSDFYDLTTTGEANWWSRGKDGYFSLTKSLTFTIVVSAVSLAVSIFVPMIEYTATQFAPLFAAIILAGVGGGIWSVVHKNVKKHRGRREEQIAMILRIASGEDPKKVLGTATHYIARNGVTYFVFKHFHDLRERSDHQLSRNGTHEEPYGGTPDPNSPLELSRIKAEEKMLPKFKALARLDRKYWFHKDRATLLED